MTSLSQNIQKVSLTGIKPTGIPHLGNYLGAIKTALELASERDAIYFIADYHALTTMHNGPELLDSIYNVAATWLALGLNPEQVTFYKQSDVPEIFELNWILACFTPKGFMNRAHAYKDKVAKNQEAGEELDSGVNMGLFGYPCLMNADILLFGAHEVPVGKDQKQHVEFARDVATKMNSHYKKELFVIPEPIIKEETDVITGLDGRKMSKSYHNTIEIFLPSKQLKKKVNLIVTNSLGIEDVKDPETCNVFKLYKLFASSAEQEALAARYRAGGMGWGEAKNALFEKLEETFGEARDRYYKLLENKAYLDEVLAQGAQKARKIAQERIVELRKTIGIQPL
jgi:tryptophanyl-tRNA synthetase